MADMAEWWPTEQSKSLPPGRVRSTLETSDFAGFYTFMLLQMQAASKSNCTALTQSSNAQVLQPLPTTNRLRWLHRIDENVIGGWKLHDT